jgi:hypothetical protein
VSITINREELVDLALALCNIESPAGQEAEVGEFVLDWMKRERRNLCQYRHRGLQHGEAGQIALPGF